MSERDKVCVREKEREIQRDEGNQRVNQRDKKLKREMGSVAELLVGRYGRSLPVLFRAVTEDARSLQRFVIAFGLKRHPGNSDRNSSIQTTLSLFLSVSSLTHAPGTIQRRDPPHRSNIQSCASLSHAHTHTIVVCHLQHAASFRVFWTY